MFTESKFSSSRGSVGIGDLSETETKSRQMSDDCIRSSLNELRENNEKFTDEDYLELVDALEDNSRKEMVVVKNTEWSGYTVTESLTKVGIDGVTVIKTGTVID